MDVPGSTAEADQKDPQILQGARCCRIGPLVVAYNKADRVQLNDPRALQVVLEFYAAGVHGQLFERVLFTGDV